MRLLALLHSPPATGSDTTIRRIASHLEASGHSIVLAPDPADPAELSRVARKHDVNAMIGTHAFLSGKPFLDVGLPYVLVLGGTDINEFALDPGCLAVMTEAVGRAAAVIAFNNDFVRRCLTLWPEVSGKLHHIPQGVRTWSSDFSLRRSLGLEPGAKMFLLPSGLRPVKDPLFLLNSIAQWHEEDSRIRLVITGSSFEPDYQRIVRRRIASSRGVHSIDVLCQADLHAAMREATSVLNTSLSECSPNAVLEAMDLGCPVMVRDIPGNTCLVEHEITGLVFDTPNDFRRQARRLVDDERLAGRIGRRGREFICRAHGPRPERAAYAAVLQRMTENLLQATGVAPRVRLVRGNGAGRRVLAFGAAANPAITPGRGGGPSCPSVGERPRPPTLGLGQPTEAFRAE